MERKWWHSAVVYQIYPKSFQDSNGDGIGDLQGIISKLDYIESLGVDLIWLCPIYHSPMKDNGYDISDYRQINPMFGTMLDLEELIDRARKKGIRIIMDLVVNHTSDKHPWFQASSKSLDNPFRDYYIWRKQGHAGKPPNNWKSIFGGSAWQLDTRTGEYYLHTFATAQPDLNWENPKVRQEVIEMVNWWLEKGIAGFRVDAITFIKKPMDFADLPVKEGVELVSITEACLNEPGIHTFLAELNNKCFKPYDIMTVAEAPGVSAEDLTQYIGEHGHFSMIFDFSHIDIDLGPSGAWYIKHPWTLAEFRKALSEGQLVGEKAGWCSLYLENHDQPRSLNKFIKESDRSEKSAKMLAGMYFLMKGTPFLYQGQELGMTNVRYQTIDEYDDIASIDQYQLALDNGLSEQEALEALYRRSRDNSRTPMQWSDKSQAGFTTGTPWLKLNPNYVDINVEQAVRKTDSLLNFYRELIQLRKHSDYSEVLIYGSYVPMLSEHPSAIVYGRILPEKENSEWKTANGSIDPTNETNSDACTCVIIIAEFSGIGGALKLDGLVGRCILANRQDVPENTDQIQLQPYDFMLYEALSGEWLQQERRP